MTDVRADIWARLDELAALKPGWLDSESQPPGPSVVAYSARIAESVTSWVGPLAIYPTPEGGVELEWDDDNLNHTITIGPDLRLNLATVDRNETLAAVTEQPCPVCDGTGGDHQIGCQEGES